LSKIGSMTMTSRQLMRIATLLILFPFFAPFSLSQLVPDSTRSKETVYQVQYNVLETPDLLKEKDEKKLNANPTANAQVRLLDLTLHGINLQATHAIKIVYKHAKISYIVQPPLFKFFRLLLI
jgi:hypothetical protein